MAISTSYRRTTTLSTDRDGDAALQSKLEQARRQRTAFYRRLAETGARAQADDDGGSAAGVVEVEVDNETSTRRRRRVDMTSPRVDVVTSASATQSALTERLPEPRSSWRYYTSYDNGEWRRHATPIYKADAELDTGISKLSERRSASMTDGFTSRYDEVDVDDGEGYQAKLTRPQRLRGTACLTRDLRPAAASSATDTGPTTLEEVKLVMKDVFDRSRYGSSYDVSELVQKILTERQRQRDPSPSRTEDRVIYANSERQTILDNMMQPLRTTLLPEIPEGGDEKDFVEKTLAPSGRRWTSSPSPDSQRVVVVRGLFGDDDDYDSGLRYDEIGVGVGERGTSLENQRDSSCQSPSNVPDTPNGEREEGERLEARWGTGSGRTGTREVTRHQESRTVSESTTQSRKDAFGRRIPADAVEIKVNVQSRGEPTNDQHLSPSKSAAVEQWLHSSNNKMSSAGRQIETDEKFGTRSGSGLRYEDVGSAERTTSGDGRIRAATGRTTTDDGRIWIPVVHVSETTSNVSKSPVGRPVEADATFRSEVIISPTTDNLGQGGITHEVTHQRRHDRDRSEGAQSTRDMQEVAAVSDQSAATASLRTGSGVGSYGFRSSIVVDRGGTHETRPAVVSQSSSRSSRSNQAIQLSTGDDGEWVVEKAL